MRRSYGRQTPRAKDYIESVAESLTGVSPIDISRRVRSIVANHDGWRQVEALSLNAAENVLSRRSRELLNSDMATRVTEGFPGDKDFPAMRQNRFTDEIEATMIHLVRCLFRVKHVEWRPVSTSMANATVFFALTKPGDRILVQPEEAGGNYSYNSNGPPKAASLEVRPLPFLDETFEIDVARSVEAIRREAPALVVVGGSNILFPIALEPLRDAADEVGTRIVYDAAHVALLVAAGMFQDPIAEGAHIMTMSSHKIMSGAVGGIIVTNDDELAKPILGYSFPTLVQTRDQNKYAATAHALAEMLEHGWDYSAQTIANARALGEAMESEGFDLLASNRGYTMTHQIFAFIPDSKADFEDRCQQANLLVTQAQRTGSRLAVRLTTQEITRRGMVESHMATVATWLRRLILEEEEPVRVAAELRDFLRDFQTICFSFDETR